MLNNPEHATTSNPLTTADTALLALVRKGDDIVAEIEALQVKLDIIDRSTDAALIARNELAEQHGHDVYPYINDFIEAAS